MLGHDIVLSCRDIALFFCRDDVMTEVFLFTTKTATTRGQVMHQVWPWAGFLCRGIVWSRPRVSVSRQSIFVSRHSLVKARSFYVAIEYFCVATEFGLDRGF